MIVTGAGSGFVQPPFRLIETYLAPVILYEVADEIALQIDVDNPDHASFFFRGVV
jgi:hypothetical protein